MKYNATLYLVPSPLGDSYLAIPEYIKQIIYPLKHFIVENQKTARRILKHLGYPHSFDEVQFYPLDKQTTQDDLFDYVQELHAGTSMGLLSEAGCPCVADPGAKVVELAHSFKIKVVPLVGPSSIMLALMASGMSGQRFSFWGYLPIDKSERRKELLLLEMLSLKNKQTQIFIETPYRNHQLLEDIIKYCKKSTMLCTATNLTLSNEKIVSLPVSEWKNKKVDLRKQPTVFLIYQP